MLPKHLNGPTANTLRHSSVHDQIAAQVTATPDAIALVAGDHHLTYKQLDARANQLAHALRKAGVGPEVLVGLCVKRSVDMVVAMLGILKSGGAYVPINPSDPIERQSFELQDSAVKMLVTTDELAKSLPLREITVVRLDADWHDISRQPTTDLELLSGLENPAYVIYTSGSTGRPKGVMVTHAGLINYLAWAVIVYGKEARQSALVHSSISFDLTITGLYTPLLLGGTVELLPEDLGVDGLVLALRQPQSRGLIKITPAHLDLLSHRLRPDDVAGKVGLFVIGGENLRGESLRFWREASPTTRLINEYGPTETVVGCSVYEVRAGDNLGGSVPIGQPIDNTSMYVLDDELKPVSAGILGELYIGGAGVARGYLNRPELTDKHFLADPFSNQPGARMYKTGDLARCREDGNFEYLGRLDDQVKIRGYRVELGEIEAVVCEHADIRQCAVVAPMDEHGNMRLTGYVILRDGKTLTAQELLQFVRRKLPQYMVPTHFVPLKAFPLTPNGKVDRHALSASNKPLSATERVPPQDPCEWSLATIWRELLGIDSVSVTENFFDLGGNSLSVARLIARIEQLFDRQLSMANVFDAPTIRQLAAILRDPPASASPLIPLKATGYLPPFFCIGAGPLFRPLALRLSEDRPFLSLVPSLLPGITQLSAPYQLEQIATDLVESILDCQQEGPYYLGGWSDSGVAAFEVARQLRGKGHTVALLVMFDTPNPAVQRSSPNYLWFDAWVKKISYRIREVLQLELKKTPAYFAEKRREFRRKIQNRSRVRLNPKVGEDPERIFHLAVSSYRPAPYKGRLVFFKAAETPPGAMWDYSRGWNHLVEAANFKVHEVPGDHETMFRGANVDELASSLITYLSAGKSKQSKSKQKGPLSSPVQAPEQIS